jgi:ribosomal protein S18 acetylase RimI-like enzyme
MYPINKVSPDEIDILQKLSKQTFHEAFSSGNTEENMTRYLEEGFSLDKLSRELKDENTSFYFVKSANEVIGYMKLNAGPAQTELQKEDSFELERIYVLKDYQGKGIGRQLLDKAIQMAREKKASYIWLGVWEENKSAIAFYEKNGFITFDQHVFMVGEDRQIDLMMKLVCRNTQE